MGPMFKLLGWFGGRSFDEMRDRSARDCDTSIIVGGLGLVSAGTVAGGQYLFWTHLAHTAAFAPLITLIITPLYVGLYRAAIRGLEVMGVAGKLVTTLIVLGIGGTNGMLVGHEIALLAVSPQVDAQTAFDAAKGVNDYSSSVDSSLGLGQLRDEHKVVRDELKTARDEYNKVPIDVTLLQAKAKQCDVVAARLRNSLPDAADEGYAQDYQDWHKKVRSCDADRGMAARLLADHQKRYGGEIKLLSAKAEVTDRKLTDVSTEYESTLKRETPVINASARSGFARHKAMWSAVDAGRIPAWSAYGWVFIVLALETMCFVLKLFWPSDKATLDRKSAVRRTLYDGKIELGNIAFKGELELRVVNGCRTEIARTINSLSTQLASEVRDHILNVGIPAVRTRHAADAFEDAHGYVERAQRQVEVLRHISKLGRGVRSEIKKEPCSVASGDSGIDGEISPPKDDGHRAWADRRL